MMKIKCGWCDRFMGYKDGPDGEVTTGICRTCAEKERAELIRNHNNSVVNRVNDLLLASPIHPAFKGGLR